MPVILKDFKWMQSKEKVMLTVPFNNVKKQKLDVVCAPSYIKLSQSPYLFEIFLCNEILANKTVVTVGNNEINIELFKRSITDWSDLQKEVSKEEKMIIRKESLELLELQEKENIEKLKSEKRKCEQTSLKETMDVEQCNKSYSNTAKEQQKDQALDNWKIRVNGNKTDNVARKTAAVKEGENDSLFAADVKSPIYDSDRISSKLQKSKVVDTEEPMTPIRSAGVITFQMTPRAFPTASRASRAQEEQEWLRKQADMFRKEGAMSSEELRLHEKDPLWLVERGNEFLRQSSYLAGVNAFSQAVKVAPNLNTAFSGRAECHLRLKNLHKAIEDSSRALDLLVPALKSNAHSRLHCHLCRGDALFQLEAFEEARVEYEAARHLAAGDASQSANIEQQMAKIEQQIAKIEQQLSPDEPSGSDED